MPELQSLAQIDWLSFSQRSYTPSPTAWEDQVLYFIMVDRFSDGQESEQSRDVWKDSALQTELTATAWRTAGDTFCGGTLAGLKSKLGYLQRLGITTIWLSPVLKQATYDSTSYHAYGTQNFLEIDPHFGSKVDFRDVVEAAHELGLYVILDIIVNHSGNVFTYDAANQTNITGPIFHANGQHSVLGFNDTKGQPTLPFSPVDLEKNPEAWPNGAIWPRELQQAESFSRRGSIDAYEDEEQFLHGDFMKLKDFHLGENLETGFEPSSTLQSLTEVYKYWLSFADLDGYRLDAVKHMEPGAVAYFVAEIQKHARSLGKNNFYIIGEVAGGRARASQVMQSSGLNAILAVDDVPGSLEALAKGLEAPETYFSYFAEATDPDRADRWLRNNVVTMYDDHDQIRNGYQKARFAAGDPRWPLLEFNALALLVTTIGIPGVYYGSEQAFDGEGGDDNYIREAMFGGPFGPFRSTEHHCFNEEHPIYQKLSQLLAVRRSSVALRRGRQQLVEISGDGEHFGIPRKLGERMEGAVVWLREADGEAILCAMNTETTKSSNISFRLPTATASSETIRWRCVYSSDGECPTQLVIDSRITIPAAGFVIYQRV
ncbi:alpha-amylase [Candidatus Woesebacteria bacterium]|nr:alpha-amylase [Candidatus Woesebacteria bacterium]